MGRREEELCVDIHTSEDSLRRKKERKKKYIYNPQPNSPALREALGAVFPRKKSPASRETLDVEEPSLRLLSISLLYCNTYSRGRTKQ